MTFLGRLRAAARIEHGGFAVVARAAAVIIFALALAGVFLLKK